MTTSPEPGRREILISALLSTLLILLCGGMAAYVLSDPDFKWSSVFSQVAHDIQADYVDPVNWEQAFSSAEESMFSGLDRYSGYIDRQEFSEMREELSGSYSGIGVTVAKDDSGLVVLSVREGGPSAAAGLLNGDIIEMVDSTGLAPLDLPASSRILRGPDGSTVRLKVFRPATGETLLPIVKRGRVPLKHIPFAGYTDDSVLYIRILDFEAGVTDDLAAALDSLLGKPHIKPRGVILDLKGNPGGLFEEAIGVCNLFLEPGRFIVGTAARSRWEVEREYSSGHDVTGGLPMAVLVDGNSASAAEITAGALRQLGRAVLIGDTTYGKGLVQGYSQFPDGSGIRLTISRYFLEGNLFLNRLDSTHSDTGKGLTPDFYLPSTDRSLFLSYLEGSLLMFRFAYRHQDEIIAGPPELRPPFRWVDELALFAEKEKFQFESPQTSDALVLLRTAQQEHCSADCIARAKELVRIARDDDRGQFLAHGEYIDMRLRQLAFERKYGSYRAYAEAVVNVRPDIRFAAQVLRRSTT
ncbi:hypothetical protein C3F09_08205 [candidate division GN15 bacterium]|uniref:PDZ domain-containing protein n=1 Tax=candidate division GN15 bacterium TaxID=2072418 RepID=A0A855X5L8_9BACT|nr:MAG: hypothetical protein C3F09_08205 [candidate division GN15 bacterium]